MPEKPQALAVKTKQRYRSPNPNMTLPAIQALKHKNEDRTSNDLSKSIAESDRTKRIHANASMMVVIKDEDFYDDTSGVIERNAIGNKANNKKMILNPLLDQEAQFNLRSKGKK